MSKIELIQGECLEKMKDIPDGSVDLVLTDPPYGTTACKWDSVIPFEPMWAQLHRIIKGNGAIVLFGSEPFSSALRMSNIKRYKYDWVWKKQKPTNFYNAKRQPLKEHENIVVFAEVTPAYRPQGTTEVCVMSGRKNKSSNIYSKYDGGNYIQTVGNYPRTILEFPTEGDKGRQHPTQKPVALLEYLIRTYTNEGETVLDFTMGSGSTGVACVNTGRNFIGIELDAGYFKIAEKRINENL
jgi:DNA modification methylase